MSDKQNESKLGTTLEPSEITQTRAKFKLRFTDFAVERFTSDFIGCLRLPETTRDSSKC